MKLSLGLPHFYVDAVRVHHWICGILIPADTESMIIIHYNKQVEIRHQELKEQVKQTILTS